MKFKIGQRVMVNYMMDSKGKIATEPTKVIDSICYGIIFDNPIHNEIFNPYFITEDYIESLEEEN